MSFLRLTWLVAGLLLLVACGSSAADRGAAPPTATSAASESSEPIPAVPPTPTAPASATRVLDLPIPATVSYGGVRFELSRAETSNEDPVSREQGLGLPSTSRYLYIVIAVENPLELATLTLNERTFLSLRTDSGDLGTELESDDISPVSIIRPGAVGIYEAVFEVPTAFVPRQAALVFGEPESEQIVLPLGDTEQSPTSITEPRIADFAFQAEVMGSDGCGPTHLDVSVAEVVISLDLPADVGATGGLPRRAEVGTHFVEFLIEFTVLDIGGTDGSCVTTVVSDELVYLTLDGQETVQHYVEGPNDVDALVGDTVALSIGYMVPTDAPLTLTLGLPGTQTISLAIDGAGL